MNEILPSTEFTYGKCDGNKNDAFGVCTSQSQGLEMVAQKYDACLHPVPIHQLQILIQNIFVTPSTTLV